MATYNISVATGSDDASTYNGSYSNSGNPQNVGESTTYAGSSFMGWRFQIPSGCVVAEITSVKLILTNNNSTRFVGWMRVKQTAQNSTWDSTTNNPKAIWEAAPSTGQVAYDETSTAYAQKWTFDVTTQALTAVAGMTAGTDYIGVLSGPTTGYSGNQVQMWTGNAGTFSNRPVLEIITTPPSIPVSVTTTAPTITASGLTPTVYGKYTGVSYHDTIGSYIKRYMQIYHPATAVPAGGFKTMLFAHGGSFNSGYNTDVQGTNFLRDTLDKGFALCSMDYKLTEANVFADNIGWTSPSAVQDAFCALKFLKTNKATYGLNTDKLIAAGYSAGAHVMMQMALLNEDATPDAYINNYRGGSYQQGTRYTGWTALDFTQGRTSRPAVKAFFGLAGAVNTEAIWTINANIGSRIAVNLYYGADADYAYNPPVNGEGNLDDFIIGKTGSIYAGRGITAPSFPIGWTYVTGDTVVPVAAGYTLLEAALSTASYDVAQAATNGAVATGKALSRKSYTDGATGGGHDNLMNSYDSTFYRGWLDEITAQLNAVVSTTDFFAMF